MSEKQVKTRVIVTAESKPSLPPHIKMRHDTGRGRWILLAPERVFEPDPIAVEILKVCDGQRSVAEIAATLAKEYNAPPEDILNDVIAMLQELSDKGALKT
jgi:pyrroloquinoline quinone biosynthesis protein D